ncbi:hypothetical protein [Yinghuangia soli]|uniref:Uncharacterized protein n=1 Tax=Yinghuangia soli TaxID=2908204 RepID=A0AA41U2X4_9ACTN|nr:hypothetical protein [Yinghuangia soli]MCF2532213.1 hypothetical protein [Yinghuangia soli]
MHAPEPVRFTVPAQATPPARTAEASEAASESSGASGASEADAPVPAQAFAHLAERFETARAADRVRIARLELQAARLELRDTVRDLLALGTGFRALPDRAAGIRVPHETVDEIVTGLESVAAHTAEAARGDLAGEGEDWDTWTLGELRHMRTTYDDMRRVAREFRDQVAAAVRQYTHALETMRLAVDRMAVRCEALDLARDRMHEELAATARTGANHHGLYELALELDADVDRLTRDTDIFRAADFHTRADELHACIDAVTTESARHRTPARRTATEPAPDVVPEGDATGRHLR